MQKRNPTATIPAYLARTQLGALLKRVAERKARYVITRRGRPTAVLIGTTDFDDMLEELDPEFQETLRVAAAEHKAGEAISLREYVRRTLSRRRSR